MGLKTLEEHEYEFRKKQYEDEQKRLASPSGIACPKCGTELMVNWGMSLLSNPPQSSVTCPKCRYLGSIH